MRVSVPRCPVSSRSSRSAAVLRRRVPLVDAARRQLEQPAPGGVTVLAHHQQPSVRVDRDQHDGHAVLDDLARVGRPARLAQRVDPHRQGLSVEHALAANDLRNIHHVQSVKSAVPVLTSCADGPTRYPATVRTMAISLHPGNFGQR